MNTHALLRFRLRSAATFGRGEGLPGLVDREVEQDELGLPYLRGKTLKGLLAEECENILYCLKEQGQEGPWRVRKEHLFGTARGGLTGRGIMHVGDACLPEPMRLLLCAAMERGECTRDELLEGLTGIRRQTAMSPYGAPVDKSLRGMRVILPGAVFEAPLTFDVEPTSEEWGLLAATVLAFRRAGTGRNRGRGWLQAELDSEEHTLSRLHAFARELEQEVAP